MVPGDVFWLYLLTSQSPPWPKALISTADGDDNAGKIYDFSSDAKFIILAGRDDALLQQNPFIFSSISPVSGCVLRIIQLICGKRRDFKLAFLE